MESLHTPTPLQLRQMRASNDRHRRIGRLPTPRNNRTSLSPTPLADRHAIRDGYPQRGTTTGRKKRPAPAVLRLLVEEARRDVALVLERRPAIGDVRTSSVLAAPVTGKRSYGLRDNVRLQVAVADIAANAASPHVGGREPVRGGGDGGLRAGAVRDGGGGSFMGDGSYGDVRTAARVEAEVERLLAPVIPMVPRLQGGGRIGSSGSSGTASSTPRNDVSRCGSLAMTPRKGDVCGSEGSGGWRLLAGDDDWERGRGSGGVNRSCE